MAQENNKNILQQEAVQDVNELRQVRVDKLAALQEAGCAKSPCSYVTPFSAR